MSEKNWEKLAPSFSLEDERLAGLKQIVPEAFTDGKVDFDALKELLGEVVEDESAEHFGLNWTGKREARRLAGMPSKGTLVPVPGKGLHEDTTENIFIEGDNLEVLKLLHKSYRGKIKMIYIDPPYNTGNDFIYKDDYRMPLESYLQRSGQKSDMGELLTSNPKSSGRFHSDWLNMMYPRLRVAKDLLREDGVVFISADDNEIHNLRQLLNELFGEENLVGTLAVVNNAKGRNDKKNLAPSHEYLLIFAKPDFLSYGLPLTDDQLKQYKYKDSENYKYALRDLRKRGRPDRREDRPNMYFPIYYNEESKVCSLERLSDEDVEITPKRGDGSDGRWRWGKDRVEANLAILEPKFSTRKNRWDVDHRVYLELNRFPDVDDEEADDDDELFQRTSKSKSFWTGGEISTDVGRREFKAIFPELDFDYPKSPYFLKRIVQMGVSDGEICLDFFAGSGTLARAIFEANKEDGLDRKFVLVQLGEPIDEDHLNYESGFKKISQITAEMIRRVSSASVDLIDESAQGKQHDRGFRYFELWPSNFKAWTDYQGNDLDELRGLLQAQLDSTFVDGATEDAILTEILLLEGFPLTSKIEIDETFQKNAVRRISHDWCEHKLFVTLDKEIQEETIRTVDQMIDSDEMSKLDIFMCLDNALEDEDKLRLADVCRLKTI